MKEIGILLGVAWLVLIAATYVLPVLIALAWLALRAAVWLAIMAVALAYWLVLLIVRPSQAVAQWRGAARAARTPRPFGV